MNNKIISRRHLFGIVLLLALYANFYFAQTMYTQHLINIAVVKTLICVAFAEGIVAIFAWADSIV